MTLREKLKSAAASAKERASSGSDRAREAARDAELTDEQRARLKRAKERAGRAVKQAGKSGPQGNATPDLRESESRTQAMFARAEEYATAGAPVDVSMDPSPEPMGMWAFASAGNGGQPTGRGGQETGGEPDWEDNPDHLDEPEEVREDLRADGLDPMDVANEQDAQFGHFLTHQFANDPNRGGRTPSQLEAEHDMVVASLDGHGVEHDSDLDVDDVEGGDQSGSAFQFSDPFGAAGGMTNDDDDAAEPEDERDAGGVWGWFDGA